MMDVSEGIQNGCQWSIFEKQNVKTLLIFVTTFLLIFYNTRRRAGTPPGPPLLPVVGNLFSLAGGDVLKTLRQFRQKYGDVFALYIGTELTVFLNGHDVLHEALIKRGSLFVRRPYSSFHKVAVRQPGIVYETGELWKYRRSIIQRSFNVLFFKNGGYKIKRVINREAGLLVDELNTVADDHTPFDMKDMLLVSTANVISDMVFKRRFRYNDEVFKDHLETISKLASEVGKALVLCNCFPFLSKLPGDLVKADRVNELMNTIVNGVRDFIDESKADENTFVGLFNAELESDIENFEQHRKALPSIVVDLLGGGTETTTSTILWAMLYLLKYPEIQETMYEEIAKLKSKEQTISPEFTKQLPYCNAVIYETLRISPAAPLAIPRSVPRDINFRGYLLPENCTIVTNLNSVHMAPAVWEDPDVFRPERFLNGNKTDVVIPKHFVPFSKGRRSCPGESLARLELFVFITTLVYNFKFVPVDKNMEYDFSGVLGATWHPKPFKVKLLRRSSR